MEKETDLQLISVHIPKSGGTSFRNTLMSAYGENDVIRLDILRRKKGDRVLINREPWKAQHLPQDIRVVHGHFSRKQLTEQFAINPATPAITWLRNPVDRVISNYFYSIEQLARHMGDNPEGLELLEKLQKSILEFAQDPRNRNRITDFLDGMDLEQFRFVGLMEHYQEDLDDLGQLLGWDTNLTALHENRTGQKREVHEELRAMIADLNRDDVNLYEQALALRAQRRQTTP